MSTSYPQALHRYFSQHSAAESGIVSAYLYGSHAQGRAHRESDVDVGVLLDWAHYPTRKERFAMRVGLCSDLIAALHENDVDLVVLNDAPPMLGREIINSRRVWVADEEKDRVYVRDIQLKAADLEPFLRKMRKIQLEALAR